MTEPSELPARILDEIDELIWRNGNRQLQSVENALSVDDTLNAQQQANIIQKMRDDGVSSELIDAWEQAVNEGDLERVEEIELEIHGDPDQAADRARRVGVSQTLQQIAEARADGEAIGPLVDQLLDNIPNTRGASLARVRDKLDSLELTETVRDLLSAAAARLSPMEDVATVYYPGLQDGAVYAAGATLVVGTGGQGDLALGVSTLAEASGYPIVDAQPERDSAQPSSEGRLLITNPADNGLSVRFRLAMRELTLAAGQSLSLVAGPNDVLEIDSSVPGVIPPRAYRLQAGAYAFTLARAGWDIKAKEYQITIDNSENEQDFHYLVDGQSMSVAAGESRHHRGNMPMEVAFDRGDDSEPARKVLEDGVFLVGVEPNGQRWELFPQGEALKRQLQDDDKGRIKEFLESRQRRRTSFDSRNAR